MTLKLFDLPYLNKYLNALLFLRVVIPLLSGLTSLKIILDIPKK